MVKTQSFISKCKAFAALALSALLATVSVPEIPANAASDGFHVSGTNIMDANGNVFVMRGVNIAHAWYASYTEQSIKGAADNNANTVRVVVADGKKWSKTSKSELENIISICKQNDLVCILEVHDATGSDNSSDLNDAVNYWIENKSVLKGNEKYVILNIANEWYGSWNGYSWAEGNKTAIKNIRNAGIDNMIMIDCAGWGQYPDSIKDYGKSVFNADSDKNTVFSIHMYEYAGGDSNTVKKNIDNALNIGVPVVIGEFGGQHTNGDVDETTIMSYCTQKNVGYLGWSWKGNSSDLSYLDVAYDWSGTSLTSWGNALINGSYGIKATSKKCSVFTGYSSDISSSAGFPVITNIDYSIQYHQIRFAWKPVSGAQNYGVAVYLAGKWRIQTQGIAASATEYTTPKNLTPGKTYKVAVAAKVNGEWTATDSIKNAVTVIVR